MNPRCYLQNSTMPPEDQIVDLEVTKAYPNDSGRGIARLDPDTLLHLKLSPGDIIRIKGGKETAAKVWRADRQDWNTNTVRIDGFTRQNANVSLGEKVSIQKIDPIPAEKVVFFSNSLYRSVVYFLILVIAAEGPN